MMGVSGSGASSDVRAFPSVRVDANRALAAGVPVSLATVYNSLHQFTEAGLLRILAVEGSKTYFDTNTSDHHHFFVDGENRIFDIGPVAVGVVPVGHAVGVHVVVVLVDDAVAVEVGGDDQHRGAEPIGGRRVRQEHDGRRDDGKGRQAEAEEEFAGRGSHGCVLQSSVARKGACVGQSVWRAC